ncbi:hypothetical protein LTR28_004531 [Elasticomyces elasticus]|nr:hypothetical protein LTR28_004531 [Elasticomyces elasticus]
MRHAEHIAVETEDGKRLVALIMELERDMLLEPAIDDVELDVIEEDEETLLDPVMDDAELDVVDDERELLELIIDDTELDTMSDEEEPREDVDEVAGGDMMRYAAT